jgi:DNA-binding XRE family transcriptional regulator
MSAQVIEKNGEPAFAVLPWDEYRALMERLEDLQDAIDADAAMARIADGEETYPDVLVERLCGGENKVKVWRSYRGLSAKALADATGATPAAISQIESGKRQPSVDLLKRLAEALGVDMDDLV